MLDGESPLTLAVPPASAQDDDDQGWAQFSRENTLRGTVVSAAPTGKNDGNFAVKTGQRRALEGALRGEYPAGEGA